MAIVSVHHAKASRPWSNGPIFTVGPFLFARVTPQGRASARRNAWAIGSAAAALVRSSAVGHRWLWVFSVVVADE